jgi:hypothetical protein
MSITMLLAADAGAESNVRVVRSVPDRTHAIEREPVT